MGHAARAIAGDWPKRARAEDPRETLARSAEDERLGRYADADAVEQVFTKYGA
jgi:hypothetical protein